MLWLLLSSVWLLQSALLTPASVKPLPELNSYLQGIRKNLRSDRMVLVHYTYIEKDADRHMDGNGKVKKTEEAVYEVYPSIEESLTYRRLISRNGTPLSAEELDRQDRQHDSLLRDRGRNSKWGGSDTWAKRLTKVSEEKSQEERTIDELFRLYEISLIGKQTIAGQPAIALAFRPRPNYAPQTREGRILSKIAGRAWFGEQDYQLIRVEAELIDNLSIGFGLLARFNKGAKAVFQRRKVNEEVWLPAESHFSGTARFLLFKGLSIDASSEYSGYRKFTVETAVTERSVKVDKDRQPRPSVDAAGGAAAR